MSPDRPSYPTRREVIALGIGAFIVAVVPLAERRRPRPVRRTLPVMGTIAEILVVDARVDRAEAAIDGAFAELTTVDRTMSRFRTDSDIGRANAMAAAAPVVVGAATADVIGHALEWARLSEGAFDPAIGRVVELWDVTHRDAPPPDEGVRRLAGRQLHRAVELGRERGRHAVRFATDDVHLDLGGIAKGHGVDRAVDALRARGIENALVNVGGDLYALGHGASGSPWRVGVRSPTDPDGLVATVEASDSAIATSGDYEQFFRYRGMAYHHVMDPGTASPRRGAMHSATVRAATCLDADAGATAVFNMATEQASGVLAVRGAQLVTAG